MVIMMNFDENLTTGQKIRKLRKEHNMTQAELGETIGVQKAAIQKYENDSVKNIKRASLITLAKVLDTTPEYLLGWEDKLPKNAFRIDPAQLVSVPIIANVSAGMGCHAEIFDDLAIGYEPVQSSDLSWSEDSVFLKVRGDSMYPMIMDGDLVLVRCQPTVDSGTIAVVTIDDEDGVVKRVVYNHEFVELQSINPLYPPRRFEEMEMERIRIFGIVKKIVRKI